MSRKILNTRNQKSNYEIEETLRNYALLPTEDLFARLSTTQDGLSDEEVENRQSEFGKNIITASSKNTTLHRLREAVINPFNIILLLIAAITYFTDVVMAPQPDYLTVIIIVSFSPFL